MLAISASALYPVFRFESPETTVTSLRVIGVDEQSRTFNLGLTVKVFNPNSLEMEILRIEGDVLIDDTVMGPIFNETGTTVPSGGSSEIELVVMVGDGSLMVLKGEELTIKGLSRGKYPWFRGRSDFEGSIDLPGYGNGPGNIPPVAIIEAPFTAMVIEDVEFSGALSLNRDGGITGYSWDMGDGTTLDGEVVQHRYRVPGLYLVELEVTDDHGESDTARYEITIRTRL